MPIYLFEHPQTSERKEIVLGVKEDKKYIDSDGVAWVRVFTIPYSSIDTKINPNSAKDFLDKTRNKSGKLGDIFEKSKELSEKREKAGGKDPIKEQYYQNWAAKRGGKLHPDLRKKKAVEIAQKSNFIDLTV